LNKFFNSCWEFFKTSQLALWDVDFGLTVFKINVHTIFDSLAVSGGVENVADNLTIRERSISHLPLLGAIVCHSDHKFSLGKGVEVVVNIAFNLAVVPDL